jgi:hypothetical protein
MRLLLSFIRVRGGQQLQLDTHLRLFFISRCRGFFALTIVSRKSSEALGCPYESDLFLGEEQHWSFAVARFPE